ncbi:phytanoyl-CoA dioxygenase family protein [Dyadobacter arcticus]|uniref:Ectoine hydroxylase-related dioxygenase (Phytanoyl-CoA dioxygenase family) n=1 Tax=Dyadobacter arcticus TaxID=1078754 RepID=A0ABX0URJ0_9BACT|nr:phytanoyl-CoA dioxygenase family protein [Dyadobacter arcticus]NIJ55608.1 ectoine hydroxylase-related dioxygenase (phytanoyl-CoA dioxygenase family) [Dyadobacter arcticus]
MRLRSIARKYYNFIKYNLGNPQLEFDYSTLPWIDHDNADIDAFVSKFPVSADYPYNLKEKLEFWKKNGYVIFQKAVLEEQIDALWNEFDETMDNHEKYDMTALIEGYNNTRDIAIKKVPKEILKGIDTRVNEYHSASVLAKKVITHPYITTFVKAVFDAPVVVYQTLVFRYGSQQDTHQDFPWVTPKIPSHLTASWIALEDISPDSGPLYYFPGSHKIRKFNFGTGILYRHGESVFGPKLFGKYLDWKCKKEGLTKQALCIKKGDVLIWHSALVHGGLQIANPELTRKSLVCHYTTTNAYPAHKWKRDEAPTISYYNDIAVYANPLLREEEDSIVMEKA